MFSRRACQHALTGARYASHSSQNVGAARQSIPKRFPTGNNPIRSASNPKIKLPKGLVYNPAPAAPSPYNTPSAFLPKEDKRAVKYETEEYPVKDMPELKIPGSKAYNLSEEQVAEIQQLRQTDPAKWTRKKLAEKFNCSKFTISLVSQPAKEHQQEMDRRLDVIKSLWTETRTRTRRERHRRRLQALRDAN